MATIVLTVAEFRAATTPFSTADDVVLADTSANIATLTGTEVQQLGAPNVDSIDATDDLVVLSIPQLINLGSVALTPADVVVFRATGADLGTGTPADVADLATRSVDFIDASDDVLTYNFEQFSALGTVSFTASDSVTITATATPVQGLSPADIAAMSAKNVDVLDPDAAVSLTAAQAAAFAASGVSFLAADDVTVADTGANLATLTDAQITALIAKGVDAFDASDNSITLSLAQFNAFGPTLAANDAVTLADTGQNIRSLTAAQIAAFAGQGAVAIDATDNALTLSLEQLGSLDSTVKLADADVVSASASTADLLSLTSAQLDTLVAQGVDLLDSTDDVVALTVAQAQLITGKGLGFASGDAVTLSDSGAALAALIPTCADAHALAQSRRPMDMIVQGWSTSLFQASQQ